MPQLTLGFGSGGVLALGKSAGPTDNAPQKRKRKSEVTPAHLGDCLTQCTDQRAASGGARGSVAPRVPWESCPSNERQRRARRAGR